jgi:hypothetical protein
VLQTAAVAESVQKILQTSEELKQHLDYLTAEQTKSKGRQLMHSLKSGDKDEKEMEEILKKLDRARLELAMRIQLVNVGVMRSINDGLIAAIPTIRRTNRNVERVLDTGLKIAKLLKIREDQQRGMVTTWML